VSHKEKKERKIGETELKSFLFFFGRKIGLVSIFFFLFQKSDLTTNPFFSAHTHTKKNPLLTDDNSSYD
jgi:hypothetical protein